MFLLLPNKYALSLVLQSIRIDRPLLPQNAEASFLFALGILS